MTRIRIDSARCTGCMNCVTVCELLHSDSQDPASSSIRVHLDLFGGRHSHIYCRHCEEPACMAACSNEAMYRSPKTGAVLVRADNCVSCGGCAAACPFDAVFLSSQTGYAVKCDLCGGSPSCVEACRFNVIEKVD